MQNFVQKGDTLVVAAPAAKSAGDGVLVGGIFGVAIKDADNGDDVPIKLTGVFDLPKAGSQEWEVGDKIYWDDSEDECTTTASGNYAIGVAVKAVEDGADDTTGRVRLDGVTTAQEAA